MYRRLRCDVPTIPAAAHGRFARDEDLTPEEEAEASAAIRQAMAVLRPKPPGWRNPYEEPRRGAASHADAA